MEQNRKAPAPGPRLVVLEKDRIRVYPLDQKNKWLVGRETQSSQPDIPVRAKIVSRQHGWLMGVEEDWYYVDNPGNLNGTFLNGSRIQKPVSGMRKPVSLRCGDVLRIDGEEDIPDPEAVVMLFTARPVKGCWAQHSLKNVRVMTIGGDPGCALSTRNPADVPVQAKITALNGRFYLAGCGETAILNGKPLEGPEILRDRDHFSLGGRDYFFLGDRLIYEG